MSKLEITELDFSKIKQNLKDYLRTQSQFEDYDFDGAGLSVLLDILAYNTTYNAYYAHMVANEMFLDTALQRKNVVSIAKTLGYTPTSRKSATATISIKLIPNDSPASIEIPENTKFTTTIDGKTYIFTTYETYTVTPSDGEYIIEDVTIVEGRRLTHRFVVDGEEYRTNGIFTLPNPGVDNTLIKVSVQKSESDSTREVYKLSTGINALDSESKVFFIQEGEGLKTEIYFGDGVLGKSLETGNVVIVEYNVSNGSNTNKASSFEAVQSIAGYTNNIVTCTSPASGGSMEETIESIKFLAPLNFQSQARAITKTDYEVLIKKDYPAIDAVRVWGGEENEPPQYGRVFVSLKPSTGLILSNSIKNTIMNTLIKSRNMVSVEVLFVDPDYIYLIISSTIRYRSALTNDDGGTIKQTVKDAIVDFSDSNLNTFESFFRYSKLISGIDSSHTSIQNNLTEIKLKYRLYPTLNASEKYDISFSNRINSAKDTSGKYTLSSTGFVVDGFTCYLQDDGLGGIQLYRIVDTNKVIVKSNAGTIDYETGSVVINSVLISSIEFDKEYIDIMVRPQYGDISSYRNQIIILEEDDINITLIDESTSNG